MNNSKRDYYCSWKFRYIKIDLESQTTFTCHAAQPHAIDFDWLKSNRGNLFNHETNINERQMMLKNERAPSCEQNCWYAEDQGQISPRIFQKGYLRTDHPVRTQPEVIDLTFGPQCNLTCTYCCKEYSSSWRQDILENGSYAIDPQYDDRYQLSDRDRILIKISQPDLLSSSRYRLLIEEISRAAPTLKSLDITGGEPFLNNQLFNLLAELELPIDATINIYTGLGVDPKRFDNMAKTLADNYRVNLIVSAEGTDKFLEFNRYGITWDKFQKNLQSIVDHKIKFNFQSTLTNLTAFGFVDFVETYHDRPIVLTFAYQPRMQAMHVMDDESKAQLIKQFDRLPPTFRQQLTQTISPAPAAGDREHMSKFLKLFVARRPDLDLSIFPKSFLSWLDI